jgi:hypothetical protein
MIVGTIICEVGTINVRFYLLDVPYPHRYCRITPNHILGHSGMDASNIKILKKKLFSKLPPQRLCHVHMAISISYKTSYKTIYCVVMLIFHLTK